MSGLVSAVTSWFTAVIDMVGDVAALFVTQGTGESAVAPSPVLLLCCVAVPLVGIGVGLFKRLITIRA